MAELMAAETFWRASAIIRLISRIKSPPYNDALLPFSIITINRLGYKGKKKREKHRCFSRPLTFRHLPAESFPLLIALHPQVQPLAHLVKIVGAAVVLAVFEIRVRVVEYRTFHLDAE